MKTDKILLCTDMDRTIIPNGDQPESPKARSILSYLIKHNDIDLAYVSGRDINLIDDAIRQFNLPSPDFAIGDVGTTIYKPHQSRWQIDGDWQDEIAKDWNGHDSAGLSENLAEFKELRLQAAERQNKYKLSFYTASDIEIDSLAMNIRNVLSQMNIESRIIWSIDEAKDVGLVDILPLRASKLHAIRFLIRKHGYSISNVVFCGDSGNDLNALTSDIQAVLVKNGADEVRQAALETVSNRGLDEMLYLAKGNFLGMNGNYAAGILEGLAHFIPGVKPKIEEAIKNT